MRDWYWLLSNCKLDYPFYAMTIGSTSVGGFSSAQYSIRDIVPPGPISYGTAAGGSLRTKTWSGVNQTPVPKSARVKRVYTVPVESEYRTRRGSIRTKTVLVKRTFYERPLKRNTRLDPHTYSMTATIEERPSSGVYHNTTWNASGAIAYRTEYTGAFMSAQGIYAINNQLAMPVWTSNDDIKLVNQLAERIKGNGFNLGTFLAEGNQTVQMIGDMAYRGAHALKLAKSGRVTEALLVLRAGSVSPSKGKRRHISTMSTGRVYKDSDPTRYNRVELSSQVLEIQYGLRPLLSDMKEGAEWLAHKMSTPYRQKYTATRMLKAVKPVTPVGSHLWQKRSAVYSKRITIYMTEALTPLQMSGLLDPELMLTEVTPWGFLADWVIPISGYLEARAFASKVAGSTVITSTFTRSHTSGWLGSRPAPGYPRNVISGPTGGLYERATLSRVVGSSISVPRPALKQMEKIASWEHALNGLALFSQVARGMPSSLPSRPVGRRPVYDWGMSKRL